jgi:hypothetical protein
MRLWMIAEAKLWQRLQQEQELLCDASLVDEYFRPAYDWMRAQMAKRLASYAGHYPWWAWAQHEPKRPRPDLRAIRWNWFPMGTRGVRLELAVPEAEVLCSDFDGWHFPLTRAYYALSEAEEEWWEHLPPEKQTRVLLEASWERIFDLACTGADPQWYGRARAEAIQATFERLRLADVRQVTFFEARQTRYDLLLRQAAPVAAEQ